MGKRSNFVRRERDFYPTPYEAVLPLLSHLPAGAEYWEPCAGDGALISSLAKHGMTATFATDIEPQAAGIEATDALTMSVMVPLIITNPPWDRRVLHPMISWFSSQAPTWLLFDADWVHTKQSSQFTPWLKKIVSVGRVKWIPGSKMTGKDNVAWHLFDQNAAGGVEFFGRESP